MPEVKKERVLDELLLDEWLTRGLKTKTVEDKTQLETKLIVPKGQVSNKNIYHRTRDEETKEEVLEVVPLHTLFKEVATEDITTGNLPNDLTWLFGEQIYLSQTIQKICLMSGFPFKKDSLNLTEAADYFTDMSLLDIGIRKSEDGFAAKLIKSDYTMGSTRQEILQNELQPKKKSWWKFGK